VSEHVLHGVIAGWYMALALCFTVIGSCIGAAGVHSRSIERVYLLAVTGAMGLIAMGFSFLGYSMWDMYQGEK